MEYPKAIQNLITQFAQLPSIGKRSAERIVLHLLKSQEDVSKGLAQMILAAKKEVRSCNRCGYYSESDLCNICQSSTRDAALLCVVEGPNDILMIEKTSRFKGVYHSIMGKISPLNGIGPEQLRISILLDRVKKESPKEVILALGADVESDATASYLIEQLKPLNINCTRIALGLPAGSTIESADEVTLSHSLDGRRKL